MDSVRETRFLVMLLAIGIGGCGSSSNSENRLPTVARRRSRCGGPGQRTTPGGRGVSSSGTRGEGSDRRSDVVLRLRRRDDDRSRRELDPRNAAGVRASWSPDLELETVNTDFTNMLVHDSSGGTRQIDGETVADLEARFGREYLGRRAAMSPSLPFRASSTVCGRIIFSSGIRASSFSSSPRPFSRLTSRPAPRPFPRRRFSSFSHLPENPPTPSDGWE